MTPILGENLSTRPEPEIEIDNYTVAVTKNARVIGRLKKGKAGRYAKTVFYFPRANPISTVSITVTGKWVNFGDGQGLKIPCTILFKGEEKYVEVCKKAVELVAFIIVCTLEILSVNYEEYQYYHRNIPHSSRFFFIWQCFKKTSINSKCNGFICFLLFFYLRSFKAKYRSLVKDHHIGRQG